MIQLVKKEDIKRLMEKDSRMTTKIGYQAMTKTTKQPAKQN
jgi:hypothetical protein